jgi:hypothetical protein
MRLAALQNEDASANDPRWLELYCDATDTEMLLTPLQGLDTFQDSAKTIREAFGAKCTFTCNEVQEKQEKMDARWNVLFDRATVSPTKLTALLDEYATLRNEVRFGITSVRRAMSDSELVNLQTEWEEQLKDLENELRRRDWYAREAVIRQTLHPAALVFPEDRDSVDIAVRRCRALLDDLQRSAAIKSEEWEEENAILAPLEELAKTISTRQRDARHALFFETCRLRRRIAFRNPLLDFDRVLFVKRHFLRWGNGPAQKQYYGYRAHGGGAICVLERPFSNQAAVTNLLANSVCERGRLKGERLEKGDYVSPELSFDGQTILFAYTENSTAGSAAQFVDVPRTPQNTYHIFRVHSDGTGLAQLTDGPYNDVDPCFLPNGRITFISERRGGCGRSAADRNYTLHAMADDGNDMVRISHHETNEWQPSIGHDGRILYTRWDIWDRGYFQAMNVWSSYPNGSDGRALFGNYFEGNDPCPNATMDVRPVPGSHQLIGTASSYFEQSYGALVVIDPHRPDDAKMTKLKRFTPEQPFAWREMSRYTGPLDFGTPWPLSEFFCLCVHDADSAIRRGPENNYGIYLVDAFGNKVLLYRDPQISCLSPIPLRPRPRPPIVTRQQSEYVTAGTLTPTRELNDSSLATVGLANVYQSYHPVPEDLRIKRLRIIQVAYKRVIGRNIPVMGYGA